MGVVLPGLLGLMLNQVARTKERAKLDRSYAIEAERNRISRDLHDTLGQQLGYLHFKLDQLAGSDVDGHADEVRRQLLEMRDLSNEAYEHVTSTLSTLRNSGVSTIGETLLAHARWVASGRLRSPAGAGRPASTSTAIRARTDIVHFPRSDRQRREARCSEASHDQYRLGNQLRGHPRLRRWSRFQRRGSCASRAFRPDGDERASA